MTMMARWGSDPRERSGRSGRYKKSFLCDACGRPAGAEPGTDDEVCHGGDGPGFFLCHRATCGKKYESLAVEERRALYTAQREKNGRPG
jgi:hypothetical protein